MRTHDAEKFVCVMHFESDGSRGFFCFFLRLVPEMKFREDEARFLWKVMRTTKN